MKNLIARSAIALVLLASLAGLAVAQTPNFISDGYYPQLARVDANSSDFQLVKAWIEKRTGATCVLNAPKFAGSDRLAPHQLTCSNSGRVENIDAVYSFYWPSVSVLDLERKFGQPLVYFDYVKPTPPAAPPPAPVKPTVLVAGPIPNQPGYFQPVTGDDSPDGAVYSDARGTFVKIITGGLIGNSVRWYLVQ